ncbi:hypothetical protein [Micromonospora zhanjiangensis]|uniref:DUF11 domain-containing protein n=1 Tax=Micromonospora zhanjiangensis TaxID=1522057 RepID=A0ABV8KSA0_9ACTN
MNVKHLGSAVRGGLVALLATATVAAVPVAASAEPTPTADLNLSVSGERVVKNAAYKQFRVRLSNEGPNKAEAVRITVDASNIKGDVLQFGLPSGPDCRTEGGTPNHPTKSSCVIGDLADGATDTSFPALIATTAKKKGDAGSFTVTVSSATADPDTGNNTTTVHVQAAPAGYDLAVVARDVYANYATNKPVAPGGTGELQWALYNEGSRAAKGLVYEIGLPYWVTFADRLPGCTYDEDNTVAHCVQPKQVLRPGDVFQSEDPIRVKVAKNAPGPMALTGGVVVGYGTADIAADDPAADARVAAGGVVRKADAATRKKAEADPTDNYAGFSVFAAANPVDLAITAKPAAGAVGDVVTVTFTATNNGPASGAAGITVKAPAGTRVVNPGPDGYPYCQDKDGNPNVTEATELRCSFESEFEPGVTFDFPLRFRVVSAPVTDGTIEIFNGLKNADSNPANNVAPIVITVKDGGSGDGGGDGSGGGLPVTGVQAGLIGGVGLGVLLVGGVLFLLARRRRVVLVTPDDEKPTA